MLYLSRFTFPDAECESAFFINEVKRTCYTTYYPFGVVSKRELSCLEFEPVTILYGGNGSGKTTALNVIAEKLGLQRDTLYNRSSFFEDYLRFCEVEERTPVPHHSRVITSDDVFDYMLSVREINEGVDNKRNDLFEEYYDLKRSGFQLSSMADYEQLRKINRARKRTQSRFIKEELGTELRTFSNGENAFRYFSEKITENALYLLDEPENSLSPERQMELAQFIEDSARFFGCQFVISTHSPFVLAIRGAKIYDLDSDPVDVRRWTELKNVRAYYDFFRKNEKAFEE